jgi:GT2 family glycosyltransferase
MATTICDVEATSLPARLELHPGHTRAFVVVRRHGEVIGHVRVDAVDGAVSAKALREGITEAVGDAFAMRRVHAFLQWEEGRSLDSPAEIPATVAICTRDRLDDLSRCLTAMDALPDDGQEVLVVDSASRDGAGVRAITEHHRNVRYVREDRAGANRARNRALREARTDVVCFCDDDAVVDSRWLRALLRHFSDPRTLCVTGLTLPLELENDAQEWFERTNSFARGYVRRVFDGAVDDAWFVARVGASVNMALRRSTLELVGPFDEALDGGTPTRSGGDHDMFTRVLLRGYRIVYDPVALNWHRHRREWAALQDVIRGYGTGVWAYLFAHLLRGELRAAVVAASWLRWQLRQLVRGAVLGAPEVRVDLALAELRGCLEGPGAYLRSRRLERRGVGTRS